MCEGCVTQKQQNNHGSNNITVSQSKSGAEEGPDTTHCPCP